MPIEVSVSWPALEGDGGLSDIMPRLWAPATPVFVGQRVVTFDGAANPPVYLQYEAEGDGTTGDAMPVHRGGSGSDGAVSWTFAKVHTNKTHRGGLIGWLGAHDAATRAWVEACADAGDATEVRVAAIEQTVETVNATLGDMGAALSDATQATTAANDALASYETRIGSAETVATEARETALDALDASANAVTTTQGYAAEIADVRGTSQAAAQAAAAAAGAVTPRVDALETQTEDLRTRTTRGLGGSSIVTKAGIDLGNAGGGFDTGHYRFGELRVWRDGANRLRMKLGAPTSALDGDLITTARDLADLPTGTPGAGGTVAAFAAMDDTNAALAAVRDAGRRAFDRLDLRDFGATCSGSAVRLDGRHTSLVNAQATYPNAGLTLGNWAGMSTDRAALREADGAARVAGRLIHVRGLMALDASETVDAVTLDLRDGGVTVPSGAVLTFKIAPDLPDRRVFHGAGTVELPPEVVARPVWYGARGDVEWLTGTMASGSLNRVTLSRQASVFDVGKVVTIDAAGALYANKRVGFAATITGTSGGAAVLDASATYAVTNVKAYVATDDSEALAKAMNASGKCDLGSRFYGQGKFVGLRRTHHRIVGDGMELCGLVRLGTYTGGGGTGPLLGDRGWNAGNAANYQGTVRLEDFAMLGTAEFWQVQTLDGDDGGTPGGPTGGDGERSFSFGNFRKVFVSRCEIGWSRRMGGVAERAQWVEYIGNYVHHILRDGLSAVNCLHKKAHDNDIVHVGDDSISFHTSATVTFPASWRGVPEESVITHNRIDDGHGIKHCGGRRGIIAFNIVRRAKEYGILCNFDNNQGRHSVWDMLVFGNQVIDLIGGKTLGGSDRRQAISFNLFGAFTGSAAGATVPGIGFRNLPEPWQYRMISRDGQASNGNPMLQSKGLMVQANSVTFRSDWSNVFSEREAGKEIWGPGGWQAPVPTDPTQRDPVARDGLSQAFYFRGGIAGAVVKGNFVEGAGDGLLVQQWDAGQRIYNLLFEGNVLQGLRQCGIRVNQPNTYVTSRNNIYDLDPLAVSGLASSNQDGTWTADAGNTTAFIVPAKGIDSFGDTFGHLVSIADNPANATIKDPVYRRNPANGAGIRKVVTGVGERTIEVVGDYTSGSYGQITEYS